MKIKENMQIRPVQLGDKEFWFSLDKHLSEAEFYKKVRDVQGYVILADGYPTGILRYNLFWDNTPFCTLLYVKNDYQRKGYGSALMRYWENEMHEKGFKMLLVSTQTDETAQHFYRKLGYADCGSMTVPDQADELFLIKIISE